MEYQSQFAILEEIEELDLEDSQLTMTQEHQASIQEMVTAIKTGRMHLIPPEQLASQLVLAR